MMMIHPVPVTHREQVLAFRLNSHNLAERLPRASLLLAAGACGLQNTPPGSADLALHARVTGLDPVDVGRSLVVDKTLLQLWSLRASPYIFPTGDAAIFTRGVLPEDEDSLRFFIIGVEAALEKIGISATQVVELTAAALTEILNGRALTKDDLGIQISRRLSPDLTAEQAGAWRSPSWYAPGQSLGESVVRFALPILALKGLCCHAERRGNQAFIRLAHLWLGSPLPEGNPLYARAELVRRYLHCYGPSTARHFAEWVGISAAQASQAWKLVESEMLAIHIDGRETFLLQQDLLPLESSSIPKGVRFLPPHDPYLAMRDRETLLPDKALHRLLWRPSGNPGVVLVGGQLVALWRSRKKNNRLDVTIEAFTSLSQGIRSQVEAEAETLAPFRGCTSVTTNFTSAG